mgnify:CR=1 FL=1
MDNRLQLFVERQDQPGSFVEVDRFNDESINVVDSIQNVKDISKIFSPFTRAFHLPSSPTNDEVFGYYYNNQVDTYDARYRTRAIIKIGGADYKVGHISMDNSTMINSNSATSYRVKFTDDTTTLKEKIGDDKLTNLNYGDTLKLNNRLSTIVNGIRQGVYRNGTTSPTEDADGHDLYPDVIYAPIFTKGKAVPIPFRANNSAPTLNDYEYFLGYFNNEDSVDGVTTKGDTNLYRPNIVKATDYRPSVKVSTMLDMINNKYALGFSDEFMFREELDQLYLWHNGKIQSDLQGSNAFSDEGLDLEGNSVDYTLQSFSVLNTTTAMSDYTSGDSNEQSNVFEVTYEPVDILGLSNLTLYLDKGDYTGRIDATVSLVVLNGGDEFTMWTTSKGNLSDNGGGTDEGTVFNSTDASAYESTLGYREWRDNRVEGSTRLTFRVNVSSSSAISSSTSIAIKTDYNVARVFELPADTTDPAPYNIVETSNPIVTQTGDNIDLKGIAPDMKILDFVSGIFKMFNLTYKAENAFTTNVQTIDEFYNDPNIVDIGEHVTLEGATVSRAMIYKDVTMKYEKSEDAMSGQYSPRANGELFPDLYEKLDTASNSTYGSSATAEGNNLSIKAPFSCMMYERLYTSWEDKGWNVTPYAPTFDSVVNHKSPNAITDVVVGHSIDSDLKKKDVKNLLFYGKKVNIKRDFSAYKPDGTNPNGILGVKPNALNPEFSDTFSEWGNSAGSQGRLVGINQTGYVYGHTLVLANDNGSGSFTFGKGYGSNMAYLEDENGDSIGGGQYKTQWWNPSNIMASKFRRNGLYMNEDGKIQGLQFNNVNTDEYEYKSYINTGTESNPVYPTVFNTSDWINGLYDTFYKSYLKGLYEKNSRLYKIQGKLPDHLISSYKMDDVYRIGNKEFTINKANINLMNGESSLELLTYTPSSQEPSTINKGSFKLTSGQFYDQNIEFDLESIKIVGNNFPDTIRIQTGAENNDYEYVIDGLTPADFGTPIGPNTYALTGIVTPEVGSGQPNWTRTAALFIRASQTAYAVLEHADGNRSNRSNTVRFYNPVDNTAPTWYRFQPRELAPQEVTMTIEAFDDTNGSGISRLIIHSGFDNTGAVLYDQEWDGSYNNIILAATSGFNAFYGVVYDNSGNQANVTTTITVSTPDNTNPEEPVLAGSAVYNSGFNIDLEIGNIYDNVEVNLVTIKRSTNGGLYATIHTENPNGDSELSYRDAGLDDTNNYKYYVFATDTSGNVSSNSNFYEYVGDPENDL